MSATFCERCGKETPLEEASPKWLSANWKVEDKFYIYAGFNITSPAGQPEPMMCLKCRHELIEEVLAFLRGEELHGPVSNDY